MVAARHSFVNGSRENFRFPPFSDIQQLRSRERPGISEQSPLPTLEGSGSSCQPQFGLALKHPICSWGLAYMLVKVTQLKPADVRFEHEPMLEPVSSDVTSNAAGRILCDTAVSDL